MQWWLTRQRIPAPQQLCDFLRNCTSDDGEMYERLKDLIPEAYQNTRCPHYTQQQALEFVSNAWTTGHYFDAHCSVFTPESAAALLTEVVELGILNVAVSAPQQYEDEFYIQFTKLDEHALSHPGPGAS